MSAESEREKLLLNVLQLVHHTSELERALGRFSHGLTNLHKFKTSDADAITLSCHVDALEEAVGLLKNELDGCTRILGERVEDTDEA